MILKPRLRILLGWDDFVTKAADMIKFFKLLLLLIFPALKLSLSANIDKFFLHIKYTKSTFHIGSFRTFRQ